MNLKKHQPTEQWTKAKLIDIPYRGSRTSAFVYHPKININLDTAFTEARKEFMSLLNDWYNVCELYKDDMTLSENITPSQLKKDVVKVVDEISREGDCYKLEALAEALWDKVGGTQMADGKFVGHSEKIEQHELPTMKELEARASELRTADLGITLGYEIPKSAIIRHTWSG